MFGAINGRAGFKFDGHSLDVALHEVRTANDRWVSNFDQLFVGL
jgi:hypothetical protein